MRLLDRSARHIRYVMIGVCGFPLVASFRLAEGNQLQAFGCPVRHWLGVICPGCGLTRSLVALAHGDLGSSLNYHAFGPLLFTGLAVTLVHCLWELSRSQHLDLCYGRWLTHLPLQICVIVSFLGYYLLRLGQLIPSAHL